MIVSLVLVMAGTWLLTHPRPLRAQRDTPQRAAPGIDLAIVADLLCVALQAGASLPRACSAVGAAIGPGHGDVLMRAAKALRLGATWEDAWDGHVFKDVLQPAWEDGADPTPLLEQLARSIRAGRAAAAKEAAARLSVHLVLPIGLCLLPAFILIGIVPLVVSGSLRLFG